MISSSDLHVTTHNYVRRRGEAPAGTNRASILEPHTRIDTSHRGWTSPERERFMGVVGRTRTGSLSRIAEQEGNGWGAFAISVVVWWGGISSFCILWAGWMRMAGDAYVSTRDHSARNPTSLYIMVAARASTSTMSTAGAKLSSKRVRNSPCTFKIFFFLFHYC